MGIGSSKQDTKLYIWGETINVSDEYNKKLLHKLDEIASTYILTMDYTNMKNMYDHEYCNKMIVLVGDIIKEQMTDIEIQYIEQRMQNGNTNLTVDIISHCSPETCYRISKFYVKIGHIYSAIMTTLNPKYEYIDPVTNEKVTKTLKQKEEIPKNVEVKQINEGLCQDRIQLLMGNLGDCNQNKTILTEEAGVPELMPLYYDAGYDPVTGEFTTMTEKTQKQYFKDLKDFYTVFTQNDIMPPTITKFSDIDLNNYRSVFCSNSKIQEEEIIQTKGGQQLLKKYAHNLRNMIQGVFHQQKRLIRIIDHLFLYKEEEKTYVIHPKLTEKQLDQLILDTRHIIVELYLDCEENFIRGAQIYEAIVENMLLQTTKNQINTLQVIEEKAFAPALVGDFIASTQSTIIPNISKTINMFTSSV